MTVTLDDRAPAATRTSVLSTLRARPVTVGAIALIGVSLLLRGWIAAHGWFFLDDLVFIDRAVREPFGWAYLMYPHAGHLMPGAFLVVSALTALVPLHWPAVLVIDLVVQLAVDVAMLRLLVTLFGRRPAVLLPLAVFTTTALTLPATVWWAAALNQLPMQLAVLLALTYHVRYLRDGRTADAVRTALAVVGGLLFSEKTLLALPLILAVTLLWFRRGSLLQLARRHRLAWLVLGAVGVLYALYYLTAVQSPFRGSPAGGGFAHLAGSGLLEAVLPGLLGGPWTWRYAPETLATADPPVVGVVLAALVAVLVVGASVLARRGAIRAWLLALGALAVDYAMVTASRGTVFDPAVFAPEYRYVTDVALVAALAIGFAWLPVRDAPVVLRPRPGRGARLLAAERPRAVLAGVVFCVVLVVGSVVSGAGYATGWSTNAARDFIATARASIAAQPPGTMIVDAPVPDAVMWAPLGPYTLASAVLAAAPDKPHFLLDGESTPSLRMLDDSGAVVKAWVPPVGAAVPGPPGTCSHPVAGSEVARIPLANPLGPARWVVRVSYLSSADNAAWISAGDQRVPVLLPTGLNDFFLQVTGPVGSVGVELRDPTRPICVGQVEVGIPQRLPAGF